MSNQVGLKSLEIKEKTKVNRNLIWLQRFFLHFSAHVLFH